MPSKADERRYAASKIKDVSSGCCEGPSLPRGIRVQTADTARAATRGRKQRRGNDGQALASCDSDMGYGSDGAGSASEGEGTAQQGTQDRRTRQQRNEALDKNWQARTTGDLDSWLRCIPGQDLPPPAAHAASTAQLLQTDAQSRINSTCLYHTQSCTKGCKGQSHLQQTSCSTVVYVTFQCAVTVQIPVWQCSKCSTTVSADVVAAGLWPSSPQQTSYLWDEQLLVQVARQRESGQSFDGGCCSTATLHSSDQHSKAREMLKHC